MSQWGRSNEVAVIVVVVVVVVVVFLIKNMLKVFVLVGQAVCSVACLLRLTCRRPDCCGFV